MGSICPSVLGPAFCPLTPYGGFGRPPSPTPVLAPGIIPLWDPDTWRHGGREPHWAFVQLLTHRKQVKGPILQALELRPGLTGEAVGHVH